MNYYIIENRIISYEEPLDTALYNYPKLTAEQAAFYEANQYASLNEILNCVLNPIPEISLSDVKAERIEMCSNISFEKRREILADYKIANAALGIYNEADTTRIKSIVAAFRNEFYRLKSMIEACNSIQEIEAIECGYDDMINGFQNNNIQ